MTCQKQRQFLKKIVELGRIPHALLFYGPNIAEQKAAALEFIKLANNQDKEPVLNPDLFLLGPLEDKEIKISQIRELQSKLSFKSYSSPFKAAVIEQAHCLNEEAQSAFLKLLEEPKGKTIFILITEYPEMLLPTILSRVERLKFDFSQNQTYSQPDIQKISMLAKADLAERFQYAKELAEDDQNLKKTLETWLGYFRENLLSNINQSKTVKILKTIQTVHYLISTTNVNPRLALEILMLEL